jgi:hypothetical protein
MRAMNIDRKFYLAMALMLLSFVTSEAEHHVPSLRPSPQDTPHTIAGAESQAAMGQTIYVPVYSHIYVYNRKQQYNLTVTLSIRNTDLHYAIVVTSVRYYDTDGQMIKEYLEQPQRLGALASTDFVVAERDFRGGSGANFIVEWTADRPVSAPVVEAVMISSGTQGVSFVSPGRVISSQP